MIPAPFAWAHSLRSFASDLSASLQRAFPMFGGSFIAYT